MRLPFCILKTLGDVLDGGELHFIEAAQTVEAARRRVKTLAELWPGQYVIYNEQTGERVVHHRERPNEELRKCQKIRAWYLSRLRGCV